jgi:hypothetical protein
MGCENAYLDRAFEWMARSVTGEGVARWKTRPQLCAYYSGKMRPAFLPAELT